MSAVRAAPRTFDYAGAAKESVPCPLCGQGGFEPLASIDRYGMGLSTVGCRSCGLVQTQPRLTAQGFADFYRDDYRAYYQGVVEPSDDYVRQMRKGARLEATAAFLRDAGALDGSLAVLDVGCSEGTLFKALREAGFAGPLFGVEPNETFAAFATAQRGAEIVASEADMPAHWRCRVGVATMIYVLEHVAYPVATLATLRGLLAPVGHVYVDVPDVAAYSSLNDLHIAHVFHFSATTLHRTLAAAGLHALRLEAHRPPGHPPSLRAIAVAAASAAAGAASRLEVPEPGCDTTGWAQVRRIDRLRHRLAFKRAMRSLLGRREPGA